MSESGVRLQLVLRRRLAAAGWLLAAGLAWAGLARAGDDAQPLDLAQDEIRLVNGNILLGYIVEERGGQVRIRVVNATGNTADIVVPSDRIQGITRRAAAGGDADKRRVPPLAPAAATLLNDTIREPLERSRVRMLLDNLGQDDAHARQIAMRGLRDLSGDDLGAAVVAMMATDESPRRRLAAVVLLDRWQDLRATDALVRVLENENESAVLRDAAAQALEIMTGRELPYAADAPPEVWKKQAAAWRAWFDEQARKDYPKQWDYNPMVKPAFVWPFSPQDEEPSPKERRRRPPPKPKPAPAPETAPPATDAPPASPAPTA